MSIFSLNKYRASRLHSQAQSLSNAGNDDRALALYYKAIELDPKRPTTLYNIGLIYKYRREWEKSLDFNSRAYDLAPNDESSRWNLAIAATALRRWELARRAWKDNGMELDGIEGPINMTFGKTPVRLNPDDDGEVVWAKRIDPVRAVIESIPFPESGFRNDDIVLHDGAAVGYRMVGDREYPVFNVLELFERSNMNTYSVEIRVSNVEQVETMEHLSDEAGIVFEDWTGNVRALCRQCSEGTPHEEHDSQGGDAWNYMRRIGLSCSSDSIVEKLLSECKEQTGTEIISVSMGLKS